MAAVMPPPLQGPTSKEKKYDRQLRLWAASGQQALEDAHILLINSGPGVVGIETLKNLVLPGIGQFTIQDSAVVTETDLGANFFLEEEHLGGFRAQHTCELLKELNPDVQGHYITEPIESWIGQTSSLDQYTLIIVTAPVRPAILEQISLHAGKTNTPTFYLHCVGFYAHFSILLPPAFPIVDTHPPAESTTDLRLLAPWPELLQLAAEHTNNLEALDNEDHGHVPYVLILLHFLEQWKQSHDGKAPVKHSEKVEFRSLVSSAIRTNTPEGGEENFSEAVAAVLKSLNPPEASSAVREVFNADECQNLTATSASFWLIARAISLFYNKHGVLPLPGSVPDMKAKSADYIKLQNVYKAKARADLAEVTETVRALEQQLVRTPDSVPAQEIEAFCKNAGHIKLVRGRRFHVVPGADGNVTWGERARSLAGYGGLQNADSLFLLYVAFLAWDKFVGSHEQDGLFGAPRVPGAIDAEVDSDAEKVFGIAKAIVDGLLQEAGTSIEDEAEYSEIQDTVRKYAAELTRAGGAELHNMAALAGGMVSQEVIKVVTKQYIPVDNTCLFDGVRSKSAVVRV
ncbi:nedd8-activating enzyme e1 regulatory subunit [Diplodia corticola]|uniref:NEDD8-activating enzyme E1 regulatory subunit n=1 Tax=Diplodia corticola TaxID=236234 RepID=A0A1J9R8R3_9PEZI|nr:nedd8-activating enzyme e1 regulatory subunit [Diplodia corticola]OJD36562.1 nedd8-activating enzyme e1 regulatory subunit [Diplodia corticola]